MVRINIYKALLILCFTVILVVLSFQNLGAQTYCTKAGTGQYTGNQDGFRYELWNQNSQGTACMTLGSGALFSGEWSGILNYLARRGLGYDQTKEHQEIGRFYSTYDCIYKPSSAKGNSYLSVYGWTVEPLVEYYIVEDWCNWVPSMAAGAKSKGTITVNGSIYDIYENTRVNQPSIVGNTTFLQIFSIRRDKRDSGTINISDHFEKWESLGVNLGKLYEVSFVVEGYQSNGTFEFKALDVFINNDTTLGLKKAELPTFINVYPNPCHDFLNLKSTQSDESKIALSIYSFDGKLQKQVLSYSSNNQIDIKELNPGMYYLKLESKLESKIMRFLKV